MNGTNIAASGYLPMVGDLDWDMVSFADVDGDGKTDIVLGRCANGSLPGQRRAGRDALQSFRRPHRMTQARPVRTLAFGKAVTAFAP